MSLRAKLLVWNGALFALALALFGGLQLSVSRQAALSALDRELESRAEHAPPERMPGPPPGEGPPGEGPPGERPPGPDIRRPRIFRLDGGSVDGAQMWDAALFRRSLQEGKAFGDLTLEGVRL